MISATALLWTRIGAGLLPVLIAAQAHAVWRTHRQFAASRQRPVAPGEVVASKVKGPRVDRSEAGLGLTAQAVVLVVLAAIELALLPLALSGAIPETTGGVPLFVFLIPLACIALGTGGVVQYLQNRRQARASARWPTVAGTITESKLAVELDEDGDEKYRADIRFVYRVGGREFEGANVKWGWTAIYAWRSHAAAALAAYPMGKAVTVHYDPAQPMTAVLDPLNREGMAMPLVFAAAIGGIGLFVLKFLTSVA